MTLDLTAHLTVTYLVCTRRRRKRAACSHLETRAADRTRSTRPHLSTQNHPSSVASSLDRTLVVPSPPSLLAVIQRPCAPIPQQTPRSNISQEGPRDRKIRALAPSRLRQRSDSSRCTQRSNCTLAHRCPHRSSTLRRLPRPAAALMPPPSDAAALASDADGKGIGTCGSVGSISIGSFGRRVEPE